MPVAPAVEEQQATVRTHQIPSNSELTLEPGEWTVVACNETRGFFVNSDIMLHYSSGRSEIKDTSHNLDYTETRRKYTYLKAASLQSAQGLEWISTTIKVSTWIRWK